MGQELGVAALALRALDQAEDVRDDVRELVQANSDQGAVLNSDSDAGAVADQGAQIEFVRCVPAVAVPSQTARCWSEPRASPCSYEAELPQRWRDYEAARVLVRERGAAAQIITTDAMAKYASARCVQRTMSRSLDELGAANEALVAANSELSAAFDGALAGQAELAAFLTGDAAAARRELAAARRELEAANKEVRRQALANADKDATIARLECVRRAALATVKSAPPHPWLV